MTRKRMRKRPVSDISNFFPILLEKKLVNQFIFTFPGILRFAPKILPDGLPNKEAHLF
jgi:hypothetical protein